MNDGAKRTEEQPEEQAKGRADHLQEFQFSKGVSGNPGGRPKGKVNLSQRIEKQLLKVIQESEDGSVIADAVANAVVKLMLKNPAKAEKFIHKFMDRDEGPVQTGPLIAIDMAPRVPQLPPTEVGADGAPSLGFHLDRIRVICQERGLAELAEATPADMAEAIVRNIE